MKNIFLALALLFLFSCQTETSKEAYPTKNYNVYMRGKLAGKHTSSVDPNGNYMFTFTYNDRGRGPEIEENISLDQSGSITALEISGVNYLKDTITEVFSYSNGKAKWKSSSEEGEKTVDGGEFYAAVNGTLGDSELLVRRLLASPDHSVGLLPSGSVEISDIDTLEINSIPLRLIELSGMGFVPYYLWLDSEDRIFASVSSWLTIIAEGNQGLIDQLLEIQKQKEDAFFAGLAKELTQTPKAEIVIQNVNVFDSKTGTILPNRSVVVKGKTIDAVLSEAPELSENATIVDGGGKTLLPGLFDNHCHVQKEDGILHLAAGVTAVRDMANSMELLEIKEQFDNNANMGPRVVTLAGFIDQKGPFAGPGLTITNVGEGEKAIQDFKDHGYHQIKLYSSIDPSWVEPLAAKAHQLGLKVSGHIPAYMLAENAIKDGFDEIQHVNMVALNFLSDTIDTRTPLRFSAVAEHTHKLDLEGAAFKNFVQLLKAKEIEIDPTVSIFEGMFNTKAGEPDPQFAAILHRLPIQIQRGYYAGGLPIPEGKADDYKASFAKLLEILKVLHNNGVTLLPGTDAMPGFALHKELENYVKAGIPASEVLQLATIVSAKNTSRDESLGSIEAGKLADLILVDGNPVENISDIRRVELTIKDGNIYDAKRLYGALGIEHYK